MRKCKLKSRSIIAGGLLVLPAVLVAAEALAQQPTGAESAAGRTIGTALLPRDLSPWGMLMGADHVVKAVLIGLALASVVTWTVWLAKSIELFAVRRRVRAGLKLLQSATTLSEALGSTGGRGTLTVELLNAALAEWRMSGPQLEKEGVKERIASRLERIEAAYARHVTRGTGVLATIGAIAPFVGLFGTVWGIMNSFIGISKEQTTNLAVVAPGIAEALLATAFGLAAAIPAVVIYNAFARSIAGYRAMLGDASAEVLRLASRDLDRHFAAGESPERTRASLSAAE